VGEYLSEKFGKDEKDILSKAYDETTNTSIFLVACPQSALGGPGPKFESLDGHTVYVLISNESIQKVIDSAPDEYYAAVQYGMLLGDVTRRGIFYAAQQQRSNNNDNQHYTTRDWRAPFRAAWRRARRFTKDPVLP